MKKPYINEESRIIMRDYPNSFHAEGCKMAIAIAGLKREINRIIRKIFKIHANHEIYSKAVNN